MQVFTLSTDVRIVQGHHALALPSSRFFHSYDLTVAVTSTEHNNFIMPVTNWANAEDAETADKH